MSFRRIALLAATVAAAFGQPAAAAESDELAAAVEGAVTGMIQPAYREFATAAAAAETAIGALCTGPTPDRLQAARAAFADEARAFAAVEPFRFGPARAENRIDRLLFWPDRRARGFLQVAEILRTEEPSAADAANLAAKSAAVQGLPALAHVLLGDGADGLGAPPFGFRCAYAQALATHIRRLADDLVAAWSGPAARSIRTPGPDNPEYRSDGEAVQALLRAAQEQAQIAANLKIDRPAGADGGPPAPGLAPYPGAGLAIPTTAANIDAVRRLLAAMPLERALPDDGKGIPGEADFYLGQAAAAIATARLAGDDWPSVLADPEAKSKILYAALSLRQASEVLRERLPAALGLIAGFNSLDGD